MVLTHICRYISRLLVQTAGQLCFVDTFDLTVSLMLIFSRPFSICSIQVCAVFPLSVSLFVDILSGLILRGYQGEGAYDALANSCDVF